MIRTLALILLIQCAITAAVYWPQETSAPEHTGAVLVAFKPEQIATITIGDAEGMQVTLRREGGSWQLPALDGLPADTARVEKLLVALTAARHGFPVATTVPARQRFEVADYRFQRRIHMTTVNNAESTVFLGTAPAYRQVHARRAGDDAIYSLPFSSFDAPASAAGWLDATLLQVPAPQRITGAGFELIRRGTGWETATGEQPEPRELEALLSGLANLQVDGIAGERERLQLVARPPDFTLVAQQPDTGRELAFYALGDQHFVRDARFDRFFSISAYDFDRLRTLDTQRLNGGP